MARQAALKHSTPKKRDSGADLQKAKHPAPVMNFQVESDSRRPDVMIPTAIKMIPAIIIAAARKKVTERKLFPSCELLPLKKEPVGVCADTDATPNRSISAIATALWSAFMLMPIVISLRPNRTTREFSNPGTLNSSTKLFIAYFSPIDS